MRPRTRLMLRLLAAVLLPILLATVLVNGLVRWVSPPGPMLLDPRHLGGKALALVTYARHRAGCVVFEDDDDVIASARRAAHAHGLEPELFEAVVRTESSGIAHRISPTGAMGPAQLTASTAKMLGVDDPFAPQEATQGGARYLGQLLARYRGDRALAIAAYNAGPGAVVDAIPRNGETELYVPRVLARWTELRGVRASPQLQPSQPASRSAQVATEPKRADSRRSLHHRARGR